MKRMRDEWKDNEKWSFMKWSLVWSPWNTVLGLLILSFGTPNPGLHYVPRKSILIERGYLDWRVLFLKKFFIINKAVVSFPQPTKNLDQSFTCSRWILNCQVHNRTVKKMMKKLKMERKNDSRVKTRKGGLEQKWENFRRLVGETNRRMKGNNRTASESFMRSFTLSKTKNLNSSFQNALLRILESITVGLDACQIVIFRNDKNESF